MTAKHKKHVRTGKPMARSAVLATAALVGAGVLAAPSAVAVDRWGPGYTIPDSKGHAKESHIGAYTGDGVDGDGYCADPNADGPAASGGYSAPTTFSSWTSHLTGKAATQAEIAQAAYILSRHGQTHNDAQAAAVDADVYTLLNSGSTYALPYGARANQRLNYPNVSPRARADANEDLVEAAKFAGPYTLNIHPKSTFKAGRTTVIEVDVTSAAGYRMPGVKLDMTAKTGKVSASGSEYTDKQGIAWAHITPQPGSQVSLSVRAEGLPATKLTAQLPHHKDAQRMVLAGGSSSVQVQEVWKPGAADGRIQVVKTAADTGKALSAVEFVVKDRAGKTVAKGVTDGHGVWQTGELQPGTYTVHEVRAVESYQLAADQQVTVADNKAVTVAVKDARIPVQPAPKPRPVPVLPGGLPQTGA